MKRKREQSCSALPAPSHGPNSHFLANRDARPVLLDSPASRDQVNDGDNQCDHKQQMDQTAGHMESPAQKPKDDEDCKNRPKHRYPFNRNSVDNHKMVRSGISGRSCLWEGGFPGHLWEATMRQTAQDPGWHASK